MPNNSKDELFRTEKDSLVFLGLLARAYLNFDPPILVPREAPTHFCGLNIHACVVDNADGDLLAIDRNTIHCDESPVQHGEQRAVRTAIARIRIKRPRDATMTVEQYYRFKMFIALGNRPGDYLRKGATCYTTLEPCPMCASTFLVTRMKRVVYILQDTTFGGAWQVLKTGNPVYQRDDTTYEQIRIHSSKRKLTREVALLNRRLQARATQLRSQQVYDTLILDHCRDDILAKAADLLSATTRRDLTTKGKDHQRNARLLSQLKKACNFPDT